MDYIQDRDKILALLRERLSDEKYEHSLATEKRAVQMARIFGADEKKAGFAGLIHDISKCEPDERSLAAVYGIRFRSEKTIHQWTGAKYIQMNGITDDREIIDAVRTHTTGCAAMTDLQKIIYLADATEPMRSFCGVEKLRILSETDLDQAMLFSLENTVKMLESRNLPIDENTLEAYNYIKRKGAEYGNIRQSKNDSRDT